jgi:GNAT superfamily N-acetyltransferase
VHSKAVSIRPACPEDTSQMVELLLQLFTLEPDFNTPNNSFRVHKGVKLLFEHPQSIFPLVAQVQERIVGMIVLHVRVSTAMGGLCGVFEDFIVQPAFQQQNIGQSLLNEAMHIAQKHQLGRLQLLADSQNNLALSYYQKRNWKPTRLVCLQYHGTDLATLP